MTRAELDAALLKAYAAGNRALIGRLYRKAAGLSTDGEEQAFFLTQAYVFALEAGSGEAETLRAALLALGADR